MHERPTSYSCHSESQNSTHAIFVSLYLALLAFFILLFTISKIDDSRGQKVVESVINVFSPNALLLSSEMEILPYLSVSELLVKKRIAVLKETMEEHLPLADIESLENGDTLFIEMPTLLLFKEGESQFNQEQYDSLKQVASAVKEKSGGTYIEAEIIIGEDIYSSNHSLQDLAMSRASSLAHFLELQEVESKSIKVGISSAHPHITKIRFIVTPLENINPDIATQGAGHDV